MGINIDEAKEISRASYLSTSNFSAKVGDIAEEILLRIDEAYAIEEVRIGEIHECKIAILVGILNKAHDLGKLYEREQMKLRMEDLLFGRLTK